MFMKYTKLLKFFDKKRAEKVNFVEPFLRTTLPKGFTPTKVTKKVGLATVYVEPPFYYVEDPPLDQNTIIEYKRIIEDELKWLPGSLFVSNEQIIDSLKTHGINDQVLLYYIERELIGYSVLQPLIDDEEVEDIVIASPGTSVSVKHKLGNLQTNIVLDKERLDELAERLASKAEKSVSTYNPLLSTRLPDGNRLTLNYGTEVSHKGTSIAIRKFPKSPWSITKILLNASATPDVLAWLWLLIENKKALLVTGTSGVGKTSLINALTSFIPSNARVVTIEDAGELKLSHSHWTPLIARPSYTQNRYAEITLDQLVKHALRMSADYIIVGEIRGEEGRTWAQSVLTGHGGITSIHSETPQLAIQRLTSQPILVEPQALTALHGIVELRASGGKRYIATVLDHEFLPKKGSVFKKVYSFNHTSVSSIRQEELVDLPTAKQLIEQGIYTRQELLSEIRCRTNLLETLYVEAHVDSELLSHEFVSKISWIYQQKPELRQKPEEIIRSIRPVCPSCGAPLNQGECPTCSVINKIEANIK
ncbi:hypothetical protein B9Q10_01705 [Candidatus Marsarchaeota G2 archaeon ECH_B_SAG-E12]|jgi:flagellar protein FlaI|uniref:Bacterial type II secretion system protein E domain-containing protein n=1 Tax=Candidatus Marsarchaeota G2 archaeon ECH_B_SAG-E12 TaxID=1978164 RepID=A0A2R6BU18_9ARCH|nr:MAG: hypothetical protein B9Q10_01705 [Candidatus Marsarchaeota G2 archaeon ECH_B_SAG-E12]